MFVHVFGWVLILNNEIWELITLRKLSLIVNYNSCLFILTSPFNLLSNPIPAHFLPFKKRLKCIFERQSIIHRTYILSRLLNSGWNQRLNFYAALPQFLRKIAISKANQASYLRSSISLLLVTIICTFLNKPW